MSAPTTTVDKVRRRLVDLSATNPLTDDYTVLEEAISAAISRYSQDRPREIVDDVTGTGATVYPLTGGSKVVDAWVDGVSRVVSIDYPAATVSGDFTPTWLDPDLDWTLYQDTTTIYLRFRNHAPAATETVRLTYTTTHTHDTVTDTVPAQDLDALCDLAAHYACLALATKAAATQDSLIAADSTNYRDSQLRFKQQADAWLKSYEDRMGIKDGVAGASATADWNRSNTVGQSWLTHHRRWGR